MQKMATNTLICKLSKEYNETDKKATNSDYKRRIVANSMPKILLFCTFLFGFFRGF